MESVSKTSRMVANCTSNSRCQILAIIGKVYGNTQEVLIKLSMKLLPFIWAMLTKTRQKTIETNKIEFQLT